MGADVITKHVLVRSKFSVFYLRMPIHKASHKTTTHHDDQTHLRWAEDELRTLELGDSRRADRVKKVIANFLAQPGASIPKATGGWAGAKGAYRLFDCDGFDQSAVLAAQLDAVRARARGASILLAVQDTTSLNFSTHPHTRGLGPISNNADKTVGLFLHSTLLLRDEGAALGVLDSFVWVRDPAQFKAGKKNARDRKPASEKESRKWLHSVAASERFAGEMEGAVVLNIGDREADSYELFLHHQTRRKQGAVRHELLIRCQHNRTLTHDHEPLFTHLQKQPVAARVELEVPRRAGQKARTATLCVRFCKVEFAPPAHQAKHRAQTERIVLWAISSEEENAPAGVQPICWRLLSTMAVETAPEAIAQVRRYSHRWQIEVYHKILKSGCQTEARQLESVERIQRCLMLDIIVAARILALSQAARDPTDGATPASQWLSEAEWKILTIHHDQSVPPTHPPSTREAVRWIAQLGGFLGRKRDGEPGPMTLWRGLQRLTDLASAFHLLSSSHFVGNA